MEDTPELESVLAALSDGDDERAEAALDRIPEFGEAAFTALIQMLASPDPDQRWWAVRGLARLPADPRLTPLFTQALQDLNEGVRWAAALALRQRPSPQAVPELIGLLESADSLLRSLASDALTEIGVPSVEALLEVMSHGSQAARLEALRALARIGDRRAIPVLFAVLEEDSALMEHWAAEGLERMGVGMNFFKPS